MFFYFRFAIILREELFIDLSICVFFFKSGDRVVSMNVWPAVCVQLWNASVFFDIKFQTHYKVLSNKKNTYPFVFAFAFNLFIINFI